MSDINSYTSTSSASPSPNSPDVPVTSPSPQSPVNCSHELPASLLAEGWRKFWSAREHRPYFFNKLTNESKWDLPQLKEQRMSGEKLPGDKRQNPFPAQNSDLPSTPKNPKFNKYSPFWNFDIPTNVTVCERQHSIYLPSHPEIELHRYHLVNKLRLQYQELCKTREGIDAPTESFNRWLLERATIDRGVDAMLPSNCIPEISQSMYREIINEIPVKLTKAKYANDMKRQLLSYAEAAKKMIEGRATSAKSRKFVLFHVDDNISWLRRTNSSSYSDYLQRLTHMRRQCQPHLTEAAKSSVEGICSKMYNLSAECVKKLHDQHSAILKEHGIEVLDTVSQPKERRNFLCYPLPLAHPTPKLPSIEHSTESEMTILTYKSESVKINTSHFCKLEQLYKLNCTDDPKFEKFLARAWCMIRRYHTYFGTSSTDGIGLQAALPLSVFECLQRTFGVAFECFASPLNCYFKQYCSAFTDTDTFFGSRGPILDFHPLGGSFEANPPFCEELMETMVDHFENLLEETDEPLSFIVFLPEWRDPPTEALTKIESSSYKRNSLLLPAHDHSYRHGGQHTLDSNSEINFKSIHGTNVFFLQNDAGYSQWTPSSKRLEELLNSASSHVGGLHNQNV